MNMRLAYVLFFFALFLSWYVGIYQKDPDPRPMEMIRQVRTESVNAPNPRSFATRSLASMPTPDPSPSVAPRRNEGLELAAFLKKYGEHLQKSENGGGRIRSLTAWDQPMERWGRGHRIATFQVNDQDQVLARAREIIQDARRLMQLENPVGNPKITRTGSGARVEFIETYSGIPLSQGGVSVVLGPNGELRALESDRLGRIEVLNRNPTSTDLSGRSILWVVERSEGAAQARYARETVDMGIQTVRDAETGKVLFKRNRRKY